MVNTQLGQGDECQKEKQQTNDLSFGFAMFIETDSYSIAQAALELIIVTDLLWAQDPAETPECQHYKSLAGWGDPQLRGNWL